MDDQRDRELKAIEKLATNLIEKVRQTCNESQKRKGSQTEIKTGK